MNNTTDQPIITAPCGCTWQGRLYSLLDCTARDWTDTTGRERMRHAMAAKKKLNKKV